MTFLGVKKIVRTPNILPENYKYFSEHQLPAKKKPTNSPNNLDFLILKNTIKDVFFGKIPGTKFPHTNFLPLEKNYSHYSP